MFSAASSVKQIHIVLDAENNSLLDQTAHFSLLTKFGFKSKGTQYCVGTDGTPPHDWRLTPSPFETPTEAEGTERWKYLHAARLTAPHATTSGTPALSPVATPTIRRPLRDRCVTEHCGLLPSVAALQAKRQLRAQCYDEEVTREENILLGTTATAAPAMHIPQETPEDNTYAMAWTDGGCADVSRRSLSAVGGWAFLLLCGRGQKYVSSSSLGPKSTNNIGEFTAILRVIVHAVSVRITQLDIKTDSMLAIQYYEGTVNEKADHLASLCNDGKAIASAAGLQFRLQHVYSHKGLDLNNALVDSMCTAVIMANDMETRTEGPKKIAPFHCRDNCAPPRHGPNPAANYRTFAPYAPLYEDVTPARGVADLSDDNGNLLHICPLCDQDPFKPNLLANRKALLSHLRRQYSTDPRAIPKELQALFGITLCTGCNLHYSTTSVKITPVV